MIRWCLRKAYIRTQLSDIEFYCETDCRVNVVVLDSLCGIYN
jgi:hypothetical protein